MSKPQLLIDTDPGVDDALAILMAHAHADVSALTIAAGNVGLGHTVRNARTLVDLVGAPTPIFAGCPTPLVRCPGRCRTRAWYRWSGRCWLCRTPGGGLR